jgi:hypothetical protein
MTIDSYNFIDHVEDEGEEIIIYLKLNNSKQFKEREVLIEVINYAMDRGYSRFVGGSAFDQPYYFFSKPSYFDPDDMLVSDFELKRKVGFLIEELYGEK